MIRILCLTKKTRSTRTKEAQLSKNHLEFNLLPPPPQKWLPHQNLGGSTEKNVQINPQTTEIWPKEIMSRD